MRRIFAITVLGTLAIFAGSISLRAQATDHAKELGRRMLCMCGCNQILVDCNHVGCTTSGQMLKELDDRVARGESDDLILQDFVQEYGAAVLASPPSKGFGLYAWLLPILVSTLGAWLVWTIVKRWHARAGVAAPAPKVSAEAMERARRELDRIGEE